MIKETVSWIAQFVIHKNNKPTPFILLAFFDASVLMKFVIAELGVSALRQVCTMFELCPISGVAAA